MSGVVIEADEEVEGAGKGLYEVREETLVSDGFAGVSKLDA